MTRNSMRYRAGSFSLATRSCQELEIKITGVCNSFWRRRNSNPRSTASSRQLTRLWGTLWASSMMASSIFVISKSVAVHQTIPVRMKVCLCSMDRRTTSTPSSTPLIRFMRYCSKIILSYSWCKTVFREHTSSNSINRLSQIWRIWRRCLMSRRWMVFWRRRNCKQSRSYWINSEPWAQNLPKKTNNTR